MRPKSPLIIPTSDPSEIELEPPPGMVITNSSLRTPTRQPRLAARSPATFVRAYLANNPLNDPLSAWTYPPLTLNTLTNRARARSRSPLVETTNRERDVRGLSPETNCPLEESYPGQRYTPVQSLYALGSMYTIAGSDGSPPPPTASELIPATQQDDINPFDESQEATQDIPALDELESLLVVLQQRNSELMTAAIQQQNITTGLLRVVRAMRAT
ncbi:hypothetical protein DFP72DRAFT_1082466 [Ephemerocybe angulata]|uniref:Uncharacterized protein n=1 Tax=Ephemerocybe angulata TaxID=980116 RepID=A0A8H6HA58_9AGAR|nr:hypothetical protein DFP72DRAFT_1082466 [Tulosesus angulatus]